ncbi:MAG: O-antigen ligase family protein [Bacteroidales bacterium]|nr:O-antigen ligase family protein [Bacteroidales bacterium]
MTEKSKLIWVYLLSVLFIAANTYLIVNHKMWGALAPIALIVLLLYFVSVDKIIFLITLLTPIAVNIEDLEMGFGLSVPTEPLMLGVLVFFLFKLLYDGKYDNRILKHPLTIFIFLNLLWLGFTSITSEIPIVSVKFLVSRLWFVVPFYFFIILMFKKTSNIRTYIWLYTISLVFVVIYTLVRHVSFGLDEDSGHWVMRPFYNDHTAYGAILTMFIPVLFGFNFDKKLSGSTRFVALVVFVVFMIALVFSYSRAAWLSLLAATVIWIIVLLKIKFKWVLLSVALVIGLFFTFQQQIFDQLERNKQDSSANFIEHIQSITNISSDASNLERINRWQSAMRMFRERPFWGWGPGTYQFLYAPYQRSKEKTIISTNAGDMGNAHSEYIGPMSESGVLGMITILLIFGFSVYIGLRVYHRSKDNEIRILSLSVTIGLISYYIHGFLNNFLNSDKASVPVWGFMAILVALDIYHNKSYDKTYSKGN